MTVSPSDGDMYFNLQTELYAEVIGQYYRAGLDQVQPKDPHVMLIKPGPGSGSVKNCFTIVKLELDLKKGNFTTFFPQIDHIRLGLDNRPLYLEDDFTSMQH